MLIIANNLEKNGGSTFLIRYVNADSNANNAILVLNRSIKKEIEDELSKHTSIIYLEDFLYPGVPKLICKFYVLNYFFIDFRKFFREINQSHFHSLGIFGLIFSFFANRFSAIKISVGIYHVNEFVFKTKNRFLSKTIHELVHKSDKVGFIFFNAFCKNHYEHFFQINFRYLKILPIGIKLSKEFNNKMLLRDEIVSVGNLVKFKSYNEHVIKCLPSLLEKFDLKYVIYGSGDNEAYLKDIVSVLGLNKQVEFRGDLPYEQFNETVSGSKLFIGNGTAVLEAASTGIVAVTGIDSCSRPISYGFVSDIVGYDYNEFDDTKKVYSFYDLIEKVFSLSDKEYIELAEKCKVRAKDFDISSTISGFRNFESELPIVPVKAYRIHFLIKLSFIFLVVGLLDYLKVSKNFRYRRNQGNES